MVPRPASRAAPGHYAEHILSPETFSVVFGSVGPMDRPDHLGRQISKTGFWPWQVSVWQPLSPNLCTAPAHLMVRSALWMAANTRPARTSTFRLKQPSRRCETGPAI
jgi:hypothetical protein